MHLLRSIAALIALSALFASPAAEARRVALVIGNGSYQHTTRLPNPGSDAKALARTLRTLNFDEVTGLTDLDRPRMERAVLEFGRRASGADVALVFFAGHGIQMDGRNYLLPVDARLEDDLALRVEAVNLDLVLDAVSGAGTRLVVLDACRNNPFLSRMRVSGANRNVSRGLAPVDAALGGTLIAFSTSPGDVAADGDGGNSPFTSALVRHLAQPGLEIRQVFTRVRADVLAQTGKRQTPWENSSLLGDVYLAGSGMSVVNPTPVAGASTGTLVVSVTPADARVWLGDALLPAGIREVPNLPPGEVLLTARREGYSEHRIKAYIVAGQRTETSLGLVAVQASPSGSNTPAAPVVASGGAAGLAAPAMVQIPAGRFEQGSPSYEGDRTADEGPVREVSIRAFALGKYEVTRGEFRRFVEATGYRTDAEKNTAMGGNEAQGCYAYKGGTDFGWKAGTSWRDPGFAQEDTHPVVCVSWNDAQAYIEWLSRETGQRYRLPSESELEYANRAGTRTPWAWGSDPNGGCGQANYADSTVKSRISGWSWPTASCTDGHVFTAPVGSYAANAFGLHDTAGNVWEWAEDCWHDNYNGAPIDGSAWTSGGDCGRRVLRGGSWSGRPAWVRSADRNRTAATYRDGSVGFRLARTL